MFKWKTVKLKTDPIKEMSLKGNKQKHKKWTEKKPETEKMAPTGFFFCGNGVSYLVYN